MILGSEPDSAVTVVPQASAVRPNRDPTPKSPVSYTHLDVYKRQAFKKTRETELVPAVLAGKDDDAKKLVNGSQKERYTKCQQLVGELGG